MASAPASRPADGHEPRREPYSVGVDVGSTATKVAVLDAGRTLVATMQCPTGYSSVDAAGRALRMLEEAGYPQGSFAAVATGYGRVAVPYARKVVTEITCHGKGASYLFAPDGCVVDVGGQDTKVILLEGGLVKKFAMNDKCSAGTGRFLEVMANRLGTSPEELALLARRGAPTVISSMCTVFAESEVISLIGKGEPRENIANGVVESVVARVAALAAQLYSGGPAFLTGGLCDDACFVERLGAHLGTQVATRPEARYAGAVGAALCAADLPRD